MNRFLTHLRTHIFRGLLAIIPVALSVLAIRFIYFVIDRRVLELVAEYIGFRIPGLGLFLVLVILYVIGLIASNVIGHRIFGLLERLSNRIPLIKTIYQVGKQVSNTLSLPEGQVFRRAVLVDFFKPGALIIGFVTGSVLDPKTNQKLLKIFIPTVPNPTSGFLVFMKESEVIDPQWTVDEAMRAVISGGIIGSNEIRIKK